MPPTSQFSISNVTFISSRTSMHDNHPPITFLQGGNGIVDYRVEGGWGALGVDEGGGVRLLRPLDREAPGGARTLARILAVDRGTPPLTSTATLTLTVLDVNDCAPTLLPPTVFHVPEGTPATFLGLLRATDRDVWSLGHGPPFSFLLDPSNPPHILQSLELRRDAGECVGDGRLWLAWMLLPSA